MTRTPLPRSLRTCGQPCRRWRSVSWSAPPSPTPHTDSGGKNTFQYQIFVKIIAPELEYKLQCKNQHLKYVSVPNCCKNNSPRTGIQIAIQKPTLKIQIECVQYIKNYNPSCKSSPNNVVQIQSWALAVFSASPRQKRRVVREGSVAPVFTGGSLATL